MNIECPNCKFKYDEKDIAHILKSGSCQCPICEKKIPALSAGQSNTPPSPIMNSQYLKPVFILLGIAVALFVVYLLAAKDKVQTTAGVVIPVATDHASTLPESVPVPSASIETPQTPEAIATPNASQTNQKPDQLKIVEQIAAMYHVSHSYTMEGGFVCLDMAIDVWNQLRTRGIESKIMGGILTENITAWNYRQLAMEGNHAWVVAAVSPTEKVAIETTTGTVIKRGTSQTAPYFRGIAFDNPAEIKRFELLRKATYANCRATKEMINDWNENMTGKQLRPEDVIARRSQIEQRKNDCENSFNALKEFESKAIFY